ncbi:MAG: tetratricopeptide repeat protein, partial [Clostridia bacterium]|nr:tetratricopeptide repeat protein [Deltaproteobacteria bacterium]
YAGQPRRPGGDITSSPYSDESTPTEVRTSLAHGPTLEPLRAPMLPGYDVLHGDDGAEREDATLIVRRRSASRGDPFAGLAPDEMPIVPDEPGEAQLRLGEGDVTRPSVSYRRPKSRRNVYIAVACVFLMLNAAVFAVVSIKRRSIAPPEVPNPLEKQANTSKENSKERGGEKAYEQPAEIIRSVNEGLALGNNAGRDSALAVAKEAALADPRSPATINLYARALAAREDPLDPSVMNDALNAIVSVIGEHPRAPERPSLEVARAWILLHAGRSDDAAAAANEALSNNGGYTPARVIALAVEAARKPDHAAAGLQAYVDLPEVSRDARVWLGEAQLHAGRVGEAIASWRGGMRDIPADGPFVSRIARLQADLGDYAAASDLLAQNVARDAATVADVLILARLQLRAMHKPNVAMETLDAALTTRGSDSAVAALLVAEKVVTAVSVKPPLASIDTIHAWLRPALATTPASPQLSYAQGLADLQVGDVRHASESFEAAQTLAPEVPEIALAMAYAAYDDDIDVAYEAIATAERAHPEYLPLYFVEAMIASHRDDKTRAANSARKGFLFDPNVYAQYTLFSEYAEPIQQMLDSARILGDNGNRFDNATLRGAAGALFTLANDQKSGAAWLTKALRDDPFDLGARLYSTVLDLRKGAKKPAKADILAAERTDRRHMMVRLYKARVIEVTGKPQDATKIYRDLIEQNPLNAAARNGLARMLRQQGDETGAREEARRVLATRPRDRDALKLLVTEPIVKGSRHGR